MRSCLIIAIVVSLAPVLPAQAQHVPYLPRSAPQWAFPGAAMDCDFAGSRYYNCPIDVQFTVNRVTSGMAQDKQSGVWYAYAPNIPRISSRGWLIEESTTNWTLHSRNLAITTQLSVTGVTGAFTDGETLTATGGGTGTYVLAESSPLAFLALSGGSGTFTGTITGGTSGATATIVSSAAVWAATNITAALNATGIDGTANSATTLTAGAANGTILQAVTLASATDVYGLHVKRVTGSGNIQATLDNSTFTTLSSANCVDSTGAASNIVTGAFVWCWISQAALTNPIIGLKFATSGDVAVVDNNQLENTGMTYATSPVFTTYNPQFRALDAAQTTPGNRSSLLWGGATGTLYAIMGGSRNAAGAPIAPFTRGTTNRILLSATTTIVTLVANNSGSNATLGGGANTTGRTKIVVTWGNGSLAGNGIAANGGAFAAATLFGGASNLGTATTTVLFDSLTTPTKFYDGYLERVAMSPSATNPSSVSSLSSLNAQ